MQPLQMIFILTCMIHVGTSKQLQEDRKMVSSFFKKYKNKKGCQHLKRKFPITFEVKQKVDTYKTQNTVINIFFCTAI